MPLLWTEQGVVCFHGLRTFIDPKLNFTKDVAKVSLFIACTQKYLKVYRRFIRGGAVLTSLFTQPRKTWRYEYEASASASHPKQCVTKVALTLKLGNTRSKAENTKRKKNTYANSYKYYKRGVANTEISRKDKPVLQFLSPENTKDLYSTHKTVGTGTLLKRCL